MVLVVVAVPAAVVLGQVERQDRARRELRSASRRMKTALRGWLRRPGPTSMPQAVSSLPSIANADRAGHALACRSCRRRWDPAALLGRIDVGRGPGELDSGRFAGASAGAAST